MNKFYLTQKVKTPEGIGIIVELKIPFNGLYYSEEKAYAVVWFPEEERDKQKDRRLVSWAYDLTELEPLN